MAYSLQKLIIGGFLYFVETGKVIDGVTVSKAAYPDVSPTTNWNDLGCIQEFNPEAKKENYPDMCPSASGGYDEVDDERVVQDFLKFVTRDHSEPFWAHVAGALTTRSSTAPPRLL